MQINDIEIIDYEERSIDWIIYEVIKRVYSLDKSKSFNNSLNKNFTWIFKYQDLDVIYWLRYFNENLNLEMFPSFRNPTNIVEMSIYEFRRRMIVKHNIKGDPVMVILTKNVEEDTRYYDDSLDIDNQIIL